MEIAGYETHPAADLFPLLDGAELRALAEDIKAHGLLNPVVLYAENGKRLVLDGRNRLRACEIAGVAPTMEFWIGEGSPTSWVVSQNIHRRHLDASQRAMVAAGLVPLFEAEARERMVEGGRAGGLEKGSANLREASGKATEKAAAAVNVSARSVESALKVTREAAPEIIEAVKRGEVAVSAAARAVSAAKLKPLPSRKNSKPPKAAPTYSIGLVMPTAQATAVIRALKDLGFVPTTEGAGSSDMQMVKRISHSQRTA